LSEIFDYILLGILWTVVLVAAVALLALVAFIVKYLSALFRTAPPVGYVPPVTPNVVVMPPVTPTTIPVATVPRFAWVTRPISYIATPSQSAFYLLAIVLLAGALLMGTPFLIIAACAVAIILIGKFLFTAGPWLIKYPKALAIVWVVLLLYALTLGLFPESRDLLLSGTGIGLLFLVILGYVTFVIIKAVFWKDSWFTAVILILLLIGILDVGITRNIPEARQAEIKQRLFGWLPSFGSSSRSPSTFAGQTSLDCDGVARTLSYRSAVYNVNGNFCQLRGVVESGCVLWLDSSQRPLVRTCEGPMPSVPGITYLRGESYAVVRLNHCTPFAKGALVDKCI
jgi:hypothetical protein